MGELTKTESRENVANRAPRYGEYTTRNDAGEWEINKDYVDAYSSPR